MQQLKDSRKKKRADAKTKIKRWGSKDFTKNCSEQMLVDQETRTLGASDEKT